MYEIVDGVNPASTSDAEQSRAAPVIVMTLSNKISVWPVGKTPHLKQNGCMYPSELVSEPVKPNDGDGVSATFYYAASGVAQSVDSINEHWVNGQSAS